MVDACQAVRDGIEALRQEVVDLQAGLHNADPSEKARIVARIRATGFRIEAAENALDDCLGLEPAVSCAMTGTATVVIPSQDVSFFGSPPTSLVAPALLSMTFASSGRRNVTSNFAPLALAAVKFLGHFCSDAMTMTRVGTTAGGRFERGSGHIDLPLVLSVTHAIDGLGICSVFDSSDSTLTGTLTTRMVESPISGVLYGIPLSQGGRIVLVASFAAVGGRLGGSPVDITIDGMLSPPLPF